MTSEQISRQAQHARPAAHYPGGQCVRLDEDQAILEQRRGHQVGLSSERLRHRPDRPGTYRCWASRRTARTSPTRGRRKRPSP